MGRQFFCAVFAVLQLKQKGRASTSLLLCIVHGDGAAVANLPVNRIRTRMGEWDGSSYKDSLVTNCAVFAVLQLKQKGRASTLLLFSIVHGE